MSLTGNFFSQALVKLTTHFEKPTHLIKCIDYISRYFTLSSEWENLHNVDKLDIESIHLYERSLGIFFHPIHKLSLNKLSKLFFPILIQLNEPDKFLVVVPHKWNHRKVYDPKLNRLKSFKQIQPDDIKMAWQCSSIHFPLPSNFYNLLKIIFTFFKQQAFFSIILGFLASATTLMITSLFGYIFGHVHEINRYHYLILYFSFFILILCSSIYKYICDLYFKFFNTTIMIYTLPAVLNHLFSLPLKISKKFLSGDLVQRILDYESSLSMIIIMTLTTLGGIVSFLFLILYLSFCSPLLASLYFLTYLIVLTIKMVIFPYNIQQINGYLSEQSKMTSFLNESLLQIYKVRSAHVEYQVNRRWFHDVIRAKVYLEKSAILETILWLIESIVPFLLLIIFYIFLYLHLKLIDTFHLLQFMLFAGQIDTIFAKFSTDMAALIYLLPGLKRLSPILNEDIERKQIIKKNELDGEIKLSNISLRHAETDSFILENISMTVKPRSFVAIAGHSGAGKSTIFKLLMGFEPKYSGVITIDNDNIKQLDIGWVRKQFGVVLQSTTLFPGTIFSNIAANIRITLDEAWQLSKYVGLDDEINSMPMKMHTQISDNAGESISGGQRQKILIARAIACKPKVLFLDEATSELDNNSQSLIFKNLKLLNITRFVIAHRYSTIVDADMIYLLNKGKVIDSGSYPELVSRGRL